VGSGPQLVEAWHLQTAWDYVTTFGSLSYHQLTNELHVHRTSAALALLAQLPGVRVRSTRPLVVQLGLRESRRRRSTRRLSRLSQDSPGLPRYREWGA
jgi:hypothetical protein